LLVIGDQWETGMSAVENFDYLDTYQLKSQNIERTMRALVDKSARANKSQLGAVAAIRLFVRYAGGRGR